MKKSRKPQSSKQKRQTSQAVIQERQKAEGREQRTRLTRRVILALPVIAVAGVFTTTQVQAIMAEADLSKIHSGKPSIVQIHDPQCSMCQTLQSQARKAMKSLDDGSYNYLVANVRSDDGLAFSTRYNATHVTLLLFDAKGEMVEVLHGPSDVGTLREAFQSHLSEHS